MRTSRDSRDGIGLSVDNVGRIISNGEKPRFNGSDTGRTIVGTVSAGPVGLPCQPAY